MIAEPGIGVRGNGNDRDLVGLPVDGPVDGRRGLLVDLPLANVVADGEALANDLSFLVPMTRLSDTQLVVLSAASQRDDGSIHPLPTTLKGGAANKVIASLQSKGLVERIEDDRAAVPDPVRITQTGLEAINAEPDMGTEGAEAKPASKPPASGRRPPHGPTAAARRRKSGTVPSRRP